MSESTGEKADPKTEKPEGDKSLDERIVDVLRTCYDPEIPVDIYELGLIYNVEVLEGDAAREAVAAARPSTPAPSAPSGMPPGAPPGAQPPTATAEPAAAESARDEKPAEQPAIDDPVVRITMTLTSPMCPVAGILPPEVEQKVRSLEGVADARVNLVWDPPWNPNMMSEAARLKLNMF